MPPSSFVVSPEAAKVLSGIEKKSLEYSLQAVVDQSDRLYSTKTTLSTKLSTKLSTTLFSTLSDLLPVALPLIIRLIFNPLFHPVFHLTFHRKLWSRLVTQNQVT